ncbi:MAG: 2-phospho-L-lactate guanylyltransferase [Ideonella sp.]|nr:2-phospho-L-lactate guanylyltransferase [Ideonella sp.]
MTVTIHVPRPGLCAVVPVKAFASAKRRLQARCTPAQRATLARLMLQDVLEVLLAVEGLQRVLVVTADPAAAAVACRSGAAVFEEPAPGGLNAALGAVAGHLQARGWGGMLIVPGDVPGLTRAEVSRVIAAHQAVCATAGGVTLVPAHDRGGTNTMAISPPEALRPSFGCDSFARHRRGARAAGLPARTLCLPGLGLDLDRPEDLARFSGLASPTRTWHFLQSLAPGIAGDACSLIPAQRARAPALHECRP